MKPLTYEEMKLLELPTESFIIDPIIPQSGITIIHGSTDSGKSTLMFTLQDVIERGVDFYEMKVVKAKTLYVNLDMPLSLFVHRVLGAVPTLEGRAVPYLEPFDILHPEFHNTLTFHELGGYVRDEGIEVIFIDTLSDIVKGSLSDDIIVLGIYRELRSWFPKSSIIISHHDRKLKFSSTTGEWQGPHDEDATGSQFWRAKAQSALHLYKVNDVVRELKHTKSHGGEKYPHELRMTLDDTGTRMLPHMKGGDAVKKWLTYEQELEKKAGWNELGEEEKVKAVAEAAGVHERTAWRWRKQLMLGGV